jgi:hypothetical protein
MSGSQSPLWRQLDTREALLIAFFATFVVLAKAALRWRLHLPGHSMFTAALFLVLARSCVRRPGAATLVGVLSGVACALLGMGKGGPLIALKLALPGAIVDLGAAWRPDRFPETWRGALIGAAGGASHFLPVALIEALAGLPPDLVLLHAAVSAGTKAGFGALGGAAGAIVASRLRHHGLLPNA